jgi:hypothetical protein
MAICFWIKTNLFFIIYYILLELKVENFITIKSAHLTFEEGVTIFTGETGGWEVHPS